MSVPENAPSSLNMHRVGSRDLLHFANPQVSANGPGAHALPTTSVPSVHGLPVPGSLQERKGAKDTEAGAFLPVRLDQASTPRSQPRRTSLSAQAPTFTPSSNQVHSMTAPSQPGQPAMPPFVHPPALPPLGATDGSHRFDSTAVPTPLAHSDSLQCGPMPLFVRPGPLPGVNENGPTPNFSDTSYGDLPTDIPPYGRTTSYSPPYVNGVYVPPVINNTHRPSLPGAPLSQPPHPASTVGGTRAESEAAHMRGPSLGQSGLGAWTGPALSQLTQNGGSERGLQPLTSSATNLRAKCQPKTPPMSQPTRAPVMASPLASSPQLSGNPSFQGNQSFIAARTTPASPFATTFPPYSPIPQVNDEPSQPRGQHIFRSSTVAPSSLPDQAHSRGNSNSHSGTASVAQGARARGNMIVHQPLKTSGHNSISSVQTDPASFALMLASQNNGNKGEFESQAQQDGKTEGGTSALRTVISQLPKRHVPVRLPREVAHRHVDGTKYPCLPAALQQEAAVLEDEFGRELDDDLAEELNSSRLGSDPQVDSFAGDDDDDGTESYDPPSSEAGSSESNSLRTNLVTSVEVAREEKKVRLLNLRTINQRRAAWQVRVPQPELTMLGPPPSESRKVPEAPCVDSWLNLYMEPLSRLQHPDELSPTQLPDSLAIAIPLPRYRAWNGYVQWRLEERELSNALKTAPLAAQGQQHIQQHMEPQEEPRKPSYLVDGKVEFSHPKSNPQEMECAYGNADIANKVADLDTSPNRHSSDDDEQNDVSYGQDEDSASTETQEPKKNSKSASGKLDDTSLTENEEDLKHTSLRSLVRSPSSMTQSLSPEKKVTMEVSCNSETQTVEAEGVLRKGKSSRDSYLSRHSSSLTLPAIVLASPQKPTNAVLPEIHAPNEKRVSSQSSSPHPIRALRAKREPQYSLDLSSAGEPFGKEIFAALGLPALSDLGGSDDEDSRRGKGRSAPPSSTFPESPNPPPSPLPLVREIKSDSAAPRFENTNARPLSPESPLGSTLSEDGHPRGHFSTLRGPTQEWNPAAMFLPSTDQGNLQRENEVLPEELRTNPSEDADASDPDDSSYYRPPHRLTGVPRLSAFGSLPMHTTLSPVLQPTVLEELSEDGELQLSSVAHDTQVGSDQESHHFTEDGPSPFGSPPGRQRPAHRRSATCDTIPSSSNGDGDRILRHSPRRRSHGRSPGRSPRDTSTLPHRPESVFLGSEPPDPFAAPNPVGKAPPKLLAKGIISTLSDEDDAYGTFGEEEEEEGDDGDEASEGQTEGSQPTNITQRHSPRSINEKSALAPAHTGRASRTAHVPVHPFPNQSLGSPTQNMSGYGKPASGLKRNSLLGEASVHIDPLVRMPLEPDTRVLNAPTRTTSPSAPSVTSTSPSVQTRYPSYATSTSPAPGATPAPVHSSLPSPELPPATAKPIAIRRLNRGHQVGMSVANILAHMREQDEDISPGHPPQLESPGLPGVMSKFDHFKATVDDSESELDHASSSVVESSPNSQNSKEDSDPKTRSGVKSDRSSLDERGLSIILSEADTAEQGARKNASVPIRAPQPSRSNHASNSSASMSSGGSLDSDGSESPIESDHEHGERSSPGSSSQQSGDTGELEEDVVDELARRLEKSIDIWVDKLIREIHSALGPIAVSDSTTSKFHHQKSTEGSGSPAQPIGHGELNGQGELNFEIVQSILDRALAGFKRTISEGVPDVSRLTLDQAKESKQIVMTPKLSDDCLTRIATTTGFRLRNSLNNTVSEVKSSLTKPISPGTAIASSVERMTKATYQFDAFASLQKRVEDMNQYVETRIGRLARIIQQSRDLFTDELEMAVVKAVSPQLNSLKEDDLDPDLLSTTLVTHVAQFVEDSDKYDDDAERTADLVSDLIRPMVSSLIQSFMKDVRAETESAFDDLIDKVNRRFKSWGQQYSSHGHGLPLATAQGHISATQTDGPAVNQKVSDEQVVKVFQEMLRGDHVDLGPVMAILEPLGHKQDRTNAPLISYAHAQEETLKDALTLPKLAQTMSDHLTTATADYKEACDSMLAKTDALGTVNSTTVARVSDLQEARTVLEAKVSALQHDLHQKENAYCDAVAEAKTQKTYAESLEKDIATVRSRLGQSEEALEKSEAEVGAQRGRIIQALESENKACRELEKARMAQGLTEGRMHKIIDAHQETRTRLQNSLDEAEKARLALKAEHDARQSHDRAQQQRAQAAESAAAAARKHADLLSARLLDARSSADARLKDQNALLSRSLGEKSELRKCVSRQDEELAQLNSSLARQKGVTDQKDIHLVQLSDRAKDADQTKQMLREAEATIQTLNNRLEASEIAKSDLLAAQESEKTALSSLAQYRSQFQCMEKEVDQLKSSLVDRNHFEEAHNRAETMQKENEALKSRIAHLEAQQATSKGPVSSLTPTPYKMVRFAPHPTPISSPGLAAATSSALVPSAPLLQSATLNTLACEEWPTPGEQHRSIKVDNDGWWC